MPTEFKDGSDRSMAKRCPVARKPFELKGGHVLAMFLGFFAVVFSVNATMMTVAVRTMPGLDARNGYDPSQVYNREIAAARAQEERGWRANAAIALNGDVARVAVSLVDREGHALPDAHVTARLQHPTDKRRDRTVVLAGLAASFSGEAPGLSEGFWDLVIEARFAADEAPAFVSRQRIRLKG